MLHTHLLLICLLFVAPAFGEIRNQEKGTVVKTQIADGFNGIWYQRQKTGGEYRYKYSGGLGTYCAKHKPFAIYSEKSKKTFFCFGGTTPEYHEKFDLDLDNLDREKVKGALLHMVSYYDHEAGMVAQPTILLDKGTHDAHDNPVIAMDDAGYIWIFSTSHGGLRPSYVHKSLQPYNVDAFALMKPRFGPGKKDAVKKFSYMQVWHIPKQGFVYFFTRYIDGKRTTRFAQSGDGIHWDGLTQIANIEEGHYQVSAAQPGKAASAFNYHPQAFMGKRSRKGLNWRTNLYYVETLDAGQTWQTVAGEPLSLPITDKRSPALVHDFESEGLLVYLKDMVLTQDGTPLLLYVTATGYRPGPDSGPRTWRLARWSDLKWEHFTITTSDNNYDMGSLYVESDGTLRLIAPTAVGPQAGNPGGEVVMWVSTNNGKNWQQKKQLTKDSVFNHTYVRRPVGAHPDFYGFWADGHGRQPSPSRLYMTSRDGLVRQLPQVMKRSLEKPTKP